MGYSLFIFGQGAEKLINFWDNIPPVLSTNAKLIVYKKSLLDIINLGEIYFFFRGSASVPALS